MPRCSLMSMGTPLFYFKIEVLIWWIFSGQSLNENLLSRLFQRNYLNFLAWRRGYCIIQATLTSMQIAVTYWQNVSRLSIDKSADNRTTTLSQHIRQGCWHNIIIHRCSTDMLVDISGKCRSIYHPSLGRYVGQHIGRASVDILTDTLVRCRSICRLIHRLRGAQNTHDPIFHLNKASCTPSSKDTSFKTLTCTEQWITIISYSALPTWDLRIKISDNNFEWCLNESFIIFKFVH